MPIVRKQLAKGEKFMVIYQSKPIAWLNPIENLNDISEEDPVCKEAELAAIADLGNDDYLSPEEVEYYMNLDK